MADPQDVRVLNKAGDTWLSIKGPQGDKGDQGTKGPKGDSLQVKHAVADLKALNALPPAQNTKGDLRYTNDDGDLYMWNGTAWDDVGRIRGPAGTGVRIIKSVKDVAERDKIDQGTLHPGDGVIVDEPEPGHLHVWDGKVWSDVGVIQGPAGKAGPPGPRVEVVELATEPDPQKYKAGDVWIKP